MANGHEGFHGKAEAKKIKNKKKINKLERVTLP